MDFKQDKQQKNPSNTPAKPAPKPVAPLVPKVVTGQVEEVMRRIRLLEERYSGLRKKSQVTEQNMLKDSKDLYEDISVLNSTLSDMKRAVSEIDEKLTKLTEEVQNSVTKADLNVISKYLDYWQPLGFLTKEEAEKLLEEYRKS